MARIMLTSDRFIRFFGEYAVHFQTCNRNNIAEKTKIIKKKMLKEIEFEVLMIIVIVSAAAIAVTKNNFMRIIIITFTFIVNQLVKLRSCLMVMAVIYSNSQYSRCYCYYYSM